MGLFDGFKKRKKDYKEVAADNTKLSERDMLINKIGSDKIQYICDMYMIKKDNLSIDFLTKLASSEEIINFLTQNFLTSESVQKMNNNNFSLNDALNNFQYDILRFPVLFKDDEKNKILLLNKEIKVSQGNYVSVQMDLFSYLLFLFKSDGFCLFKFDKVSSMEGKSFCSRNVSYGAVP